MATTLDIEAKNKKFHRLSDAKKRVAIAKDVLLCLRKGTIQATRGYYFHAKGKTSEELANTGSQDQIQPFLLKPTAKCEACAIGACFVSAARLGNRAKIADRHEAETYPRRYFDAKQLGLMEFAFESWRPSDKTLRGGVGRVSPDDQLRAAAFRRGVRSSVVRLRNIMQNVVRNKGTFKP